MKIVESRSVEQQLNEAVYKWKIDSIDRSWFISQDGKLLSGASHRSILKQTFKIEWQQLSERGMSDSDIDQIFEKRLLKSGWIKIGELSEFYCETETLSSRIKDMIAGFTDSLLKVRPEAEKSILTITVHNSGAIFKLKMKEIAEDKLFIPIIYEVEKYD